jgi:hypothetical protein
LAANLDNYPSNAKIREDVTALQQAGRGLVILHRQWFIGETNSGVLA